MFLDHDLGGEDVEADAGDEEYPADDREYVEAEACKEGAQENQAQGGVVGG